jgi:hypothetical protein
VKASRSKEKDRTSWSVHTVIASLEIKQPTADCKRFRNAKSLNSRFLLHAVEPLGVESKVVLDALRKTSHYLAQRKERMKTKTMLLAGAVGLLGLLAISYMTQAQSKPIAQRVELAILKWDGNDRVQLMTPTKNEVIRVLQAGGQKITDIPDEEYCVTWVANKLAQEGWEPVNLNNRRILMQRPISR